VQDDYLTYLNYQIKEEVINGYLKERIILEEEKKEFSSELESYREIAAAAGKIRDHLACLLVTPENLAHFFSLIGFDRPPLSWVSYTEVMNQPPACPVGLSPKGFTDRGRYLDLVLKTYNEFRLLTGKGQEAAGNLTALADEINMDIKTFEQNYDILNIINFLKSMDVETLLKKKVMGGNFSPGEMNSLYEAMVIKPVSLETERIHSWPELPLPREVKRRTMHFVFTVFEQYKEAIRPALR